ncbi:MAG: DUF6494 family protein [Aggregatilineales bacterium]|nr:hypothetical protein [Chloroflexota bacterium]HOA23548.1 DUF6494 family protein [Aggregatilineales bacterium]HQE16976.1 DUF6494 family protein [Aggregatilineales bacterium]
MNEATQTDIRKLLKRFGVEADRAISEYIKQVPGDKPLQLRITLEDMTDYGDDAPAEWLYVQIEGEVRRG